MKGQGVGRKPALGMAAAGVWRLDQRDFTHNGVDKCCSNGVTK